jgi:predicted RNA-binding protein YlqC (UPF0109 family)
MKNNDATSTAADIAVNLVGRIVREFTFHHDDLKIWVELMGRVQIVYMQTHKADMPRVIGKQGAHRNALFNLTEMIGQRYKAELRFENVEPEAGEVERFKPFQAAGRWDSRPIVQLMKDCCQSIFQYETKVSITDSGHTPTSNLQVVVSNQENMQYTARAAEILKVLFNAIGKRHGRILLVDLISDKELERLQSK